MRRILDVPVSFRRQFSTSRDRLKKDVILKAILEVHDAFGKGFEAHVFGTTSYKPIVDRMSISMGQKGEIDMVALGDYNTFKSFLCDGLHKLSEDANDRVQRPHIFVAELALTSSGLAAKFGGKQHTRMDSIVRKCHESGINAVQMFVFNGSFREALDLLDSNRASKFLMQPGAGLIHVPYASGPTIHEMIEKQTKEIEKQTEEIKMLKQKIDQSLETRIKK